MGTFPGRAAAWAVHLYTAAGAAVAFFATLDALEGDARGALLWLYLATVIDSTDGPLSRVARVKERVPELDGGRLDDIVDYLTFVFVPVVLLHTTGRLPDGWGGGVAVAVLLSSAYGFSRTDAKTPDHFFTGFPSYWNIVAVYLIAGDVSPAVSGVLLLVLAALVFVPLGYVYPTRTPTLRLVTLLGGVAWAAAILAVVLQMPAVSRPLLFASLLFPLYYVALSLTLHRRRVTELQRSRTA